MVVDLRLWPRSRLRLRFGAPRTRRRNRPPSGHAVALVQPRRRDRSNRDRLAHIAVDLETSTKTTFRRSLRSRLFNPGRYCRRILADRADRFEIVRRTAASDQPFAFEVCKGMQRGQKGAK